MIGTRSSTRLSGTDGDWILVCTTHRITYLYALAGIVIPSGMKRSGTLILGRLGFSQTNVEKVLNLNNMYYIFCIYGNNPNTITNK